MNWRYATDATMLRPYDVAADLAGNTYVVLYVYGGHPLQRGGPTIVKIAPDGTITNLADNDGWFGQPDTAKNRDVFTNTAGIAIDSAGNMLIMSTDLQGVGDVIYKVSPTGVLTNVAGDGAADGAMVDGTGKAAHFVEAYIVGIDYDDNLYVLDGKVPRKVTPAGVVTTLAALPRGLNADMKGNTYARATDSGKLAVTDPSGTTTLFTGAPYCDSVVPAPPLACLVGDIRATVAAGGNAQLLIDSQSIRRLVLPR